jgi:undecaprenyl-phosphate 4-deoxy-4-formamido-L-arabinose transferase
MLAIRSTTDDRPRVSVIVPVYNSATTIAELVARLTAVLEQCAAAYELLLVDDGSADQSVDVLAGLARHDPRVCVLPLSRNFGQHNALLCGIRAARYDLIVTIDDDLQNPPEQIPVLLSRLTDDVDVVYGAPRDRRHDGWRWGMSALTRMAMSRGLGAATARSLSSFRVFRAPLREAFAAYEGSFVSIDVLLSWGTRRFASVAVEHHPRRTGGSHYRLRTLAALAVNMMTGFSTLPLQIATIGGVVIAALGLVALAYGLSRQMWSGAPVPDAQLLASVIVVLAGVQLVALGIIGAYLARMHFRLMGHPSYVVRPATVPARTGEGDVPRA